MAEKEGFEPSRQSPQPTPLAGEPLTATWVLLHGYIAGAMLNYLAEREGFEPPVPLSTTVFKTVVIDHSTISPRLCLGSSLPQKRCKGTGLFSFIQIF